MQPERGAIPTHDSILASLNTFLRQMELPPLDLACARDARAKMEFGLPSDRVPQLIDGLFDSFSKKHPHMRHPRYGIRVRDEHGLPAEKLEEFSRCKAGMIEFANDLWSSHLVVDDLYKPIEGFAEMLAASRWRIEEPLRSLRCHYVNDRTSLQRRDGYDSEYDSLSRWTLAIDGRELPVDVQLTIAEYVPGDLTGSSTVCAHGKAGVDIGALSEALQPLSGAEIAEIVEKTILHTSQAGRNLSYEGKISLLRSAEILPNAVRCSGSAPLDLKAIPLSGYSGPRSIGELQLICVDRSAAPDLADRAFAASGFLSLPILSAESLRRIAPISPHDSVMQDAIELEMRTKNSLLWQLIEVSSGKAEFLHASVKLSLMNAYWHLTQLGELPLVRQDTFEEVLEDGLVAVTRIHGLRRNEAEMLSEDPLFLDLMVFPVTRRPESEAPSDVSEFLALFRRMLSVELRKRIRSDV